MRDIANHTRGLFSISDGFSDREFHCMVSFVSVEYFFVVNIVSALHRNQKQSREHKMAGEGRLLVLGLWMKIGCESLALLGQVHYILQGLVELHAEFLEGQLLLVELFLEGINGSLELLDRSLAKLGASLRVLQLLAQAPHGVIVVVLLLGVLAAKVLHLLQLLVVLADLHFGVLDFGLELLALVDHSLEVALDDSQLSGDLLVLSVGLLGDGGGLLELGANELEFFLDGEGLGLVDLSLSLVLLERRLVLGQLGHGLLVSLVDFGLFVFQESDLSGESGYLKLGVGGGGFGLFESLGGGDVGGHSIIESLLSFADQLLDVPDALIGLVTLGLVDFDLVLEGGGLLHQLLLLGDESVHFMLNG